MTKTQSQASIDLGALLDGELSHPNQTTQP